MKGAFHLRSPAPRYEATWPVHKVASFLKNLGSSTDLAIIEMAVLETCNPHGSGFISCRCCSELQLMEVPT